MQPNVAGVSPASASAGGASSSDAAAKPKRARTSKPKVKTGCNNCKQRRIKCDEKRPACTQCVRAKKTCAGYPPPNRSARAHEVLAIAPKPPTNGQALAPLAMAPAAASAVAVTARHSIQLTPRRIHKGLIRSKMTPPQTPVAGASSVVLYHQPAATQPFAQVEGLYFQLFRTHTASELSGYFDSVFWTRTVLQECHSEAAIRHAVVALGALYKTLEQSAESPPGSPSETSNGKRQEAMDHALRHWEVAVKQYSDACQALFQLPSNDRRCDRIRLMASVLLACFDSFVGDHRQAIKQIQTGLALLDQLRVEKRRAFLPGPEEPVEDELVQIFTRLAIQAKSYDMAFHFPQPYVVKLTPASASGSAGLEAQQLLPTSPTSEPGSPSSASGAGGGSGVDTIPERFATLREARLAWDRLCERMLRFTETLFSYASAESPLGVLPRSLKALGMGFKDQLTAWSEAFEHILDARTAPGISSQEKAGIAVLKMFQVMGSVLFLMTFSDSESQFDLFQPQFKSIVDLALEVVGDEERRAAAARCPDPALCPHRGAQGPDIFGGHEYAACHIKPSFSADLGIVPPLFVVATKCRSPIIRRQAIQLLRSSARREGMWDSELTARIGHWVTSIEEEDDATSPLPADGSSPPPPNGHPTPAASPTAGVDLPRDVPLGPGGNARWERRESAFGVGRAMKRTVPEEKRVMVRAVDFDLRARFARLRVGTRGLHPSAPDLRSRETQIVW